MTKNNSIKFLSNEKKNKEKNEKPKAVAQSIFKTKIDVLQLLKDDPFFFTC